MAKDREGYVQAQINLDETPRAHKVFCAETADGDGALVMQSEDGEAIAIAIMSADLMLAYAADIAETANDLKRKQGTLT